MICSCRPNLDRAQAMEVRSSRGAIFLTTILMMMAQWCCWGVATQEAFDPTSGFTQLAFNCEIQKPYDLQVTDRFSFEAGVYDMWVLSTDNPYIEGSRTMPRCELHVVGLDYNSGVWQFEGDFFVASNISGICIMQILADSKVTATALQVRVVDGNLLRYSGGLPTQTVATMVSNQWVHLNVIHDADSKSIQIFVNDVLAHKELTNTYKNHYFKYGAAYTSNTSSPCIEVLWKNVAIWKKSTQINSEAIVAGGTASCFPQ